ncbi:MAG: hypothetical protein QJR08_04380 [Bacillota bacterium]|nr:hypothetical protein [Bacillota bacterium]
MSDEEVQVTLARHDERIKGLEEVYNDIYDQLQSIKTWLMVTLGSVATSAILLAVNILVRGK